MSDKIEMVKVYILGEGFDVPAASTIMGAMEYAGFQLTHGVGCREGFCGACGTIYREKGDYKLKGGLACQTVVTDGMHLAQIPFMPAEKATYNIDELTPDIDSIKKAYPILFRCVGCNTCSKACPQDISVMDYVQDMIKGNIAKAADRSFDCIRCGLCALRCPVEIVQYNAAILARRLYGKYLMGKSEDMEKKVEDVNVGKYDQEIKELHDMELTNLKKKYYSRDINIK